MPKTSTEIDTQDLAGLRDPDACKGLLPSEQQEFRGLFEDLRTLIIGMKDDAAPAWYARRRM